jgi:hypothetical protein
MYVIPAFNEAEASMLRDLLASSGTFNHIEILPGKFEGDTIREPAEQRKKIAQNIEYLYNILAESNPRRTFASVDTKEVVQAVMNRVPHNVYIEDGAAAYTSETTGWSSYRSKLLNKIIYRVKSKFWWENVNIYGTSSHIDSIQAVYPEYRRQELKNEPATQICGKPIVNLTKTKQYDVYIKKHDQTRSLTKDIDGMICVSHSSKLERDSEYKRTLNTLVQHISHSDLEFAVKFHPRDININDFPDPLLSEFIRLPSTIPLELLYPRQTMNINFLIGYSSSALYTAQWLCNDLEIISLGRILDGINEELVNFFNEIGIITPHTYDEIFPIGGQ